MKKLMRSLFGGSQPSPPATLPPGNGRDYPATIEDGSDNAMRRQLVQVLLRDVLRRHGIPAQWIELQMLVVSSSSRGAGMYVRLVIKQWDARLMNYTQAFQNALFADISRFEPRAFEWLHGISWQLEMSDSCPYTELPDKAFWAEPAKTSAPVVALVPAAQAVPAAWATPAKAAVPSSTPESDARDDLERLFNIRDQEIGRASHAPVGYEKTQASPLS